AVSAAANSVSLLVRGTDGSLLYRGVDGGVWIPWAPIGSSTNEPSATAWDGQVSVFARQSDGSLAHRKRGTNGQWSAWESLGTPSGGIAGSPKSTSPGAGVVQVFVRTGTGHLASRRFAAGVWSAWEDLGLSSSVGFGAGAAGGNTVVAARSSSDQLL